jgi:hypothetical protein
VGQSLELAAWAAACPPLHPGPFLLQLVMGRERVVSTVFQIGDERREFVQGRKDIPAARDRRQGQLLAGADGGAEIGDVARGAKPRSRNSSKRMAQVSASRWSSRRSRKQ